MASNLSSIGFVFDSAEGFQETMLRLASATVERVDCDAGDYSIWRSRTGGEIWFHLPFLATEDDARDIAGLTPFYEGLGVMSLEVESRVSRPDDNPFEGALTAHLLEENGASVYPLTFDAVDFAAHRNIELPIRVNARIVCLARELRAFRDEAAFAASSDGSLDGAGLAPQAFIPIGHFVEKEDCGESAPESTALLTGRVAEHRSLVNEVTGRNFHWLLVETLAATIDVVADPTIIEGDILEGGTVEVTGVLFGRLLQPD